MRGNVVKNKNMLFGNIRRGMSKYFIGMLIASNFLIGQASCKRVHKRTPRQITTDDSYQEEERLRRMSKMFREYRSKIAAKEEEAKKLKGIAKYKKLLEVSRMKNDLLRKKIRYLENSPSYEDFSREIRSVERKLMDLKKINSKLKEALNKTRKHRDQLIRENQKLKNENSELMSMFDSSSNENTKLIQRIRALKEKVKTLKSKNRLLRNSLLKWNSK